MSFGPAAMISSIMASLSGRKPTWSLASDRNRLDRVMVNGRYTRCQIRKGDLHLVRVAVLHALGMESWKQVEVEVKRNLIEKSRLSNSD